jgi:hypothetical protein
MAISATQVSRVLGVHCMRSRKRSSRIRGMSIIGSGFKVTKPYEWAPVCVEHVGQDGVPVTDKRFLMERLERYVAILTEAGYTPRIISSIQGPRVLVTRED